VISHNVITSGQLPRDMGWSNEVYRDADAVVGPKDAYYVTSSMSCSQFRALIQHGNYKKIQDYLDDRFGEGATFASISQKRTSACTSGWTRAMDAGDIIFQIRGSSASSCDGRPGWRVPEYANGPAGFFDLSSCSRWYTWQQAGAYGTGTTSPANIYPLDGNRFVPGPDVAHLGGDTWSADAAIDVIEGDSAWRGMMVSLGAIDKMGHMWGPEDDVTGPPGSDQQISHLPYAAKNADVQVGRIVDALSDEGLLDDTLIVITADHAAQTGTGEHFHGVLAPAVTLPQCALPPEYPQSTPASTGIRSDCNWYLGTENGTPADEIYEVPSDAVKELDTRLAGNLAFSYQDTQVAAWLNDRSLAKKQEAAAAVLDMPDVMASYYINEAQDGYQPYGTNRITGAERAWFARHAQELVDTMANSAAPDVVGLVRTNATYGVTGDHGGSTKLVQNIPMVFYGPGVGAKDSNRELRLVDVMPTILNTMGIPYDGASVDGEAVKLSKPKG
jgi:Type I phosphodiesterase / nucleotide pyrophosphatase